MKLAAAIAAVLAVGVPATAEAFCGFYVGGGDQKRFNDATQVVLMRLGTRTVLTMQNHYQGPPEAFAIVVPVPVVLRAGDVKTLPADVFARVDQMGAPRLVEYWEQDPCAPRRDDPTTATSPAAPDALGSAAGTTTGDGVTVAARFTAGEYQIVIVSAADSARLAAWLADQGYQVPADAEALLRPYVASGMKFFVAKVDPAKVQLVGGRAALSPLRFHYDSEELVLPIRLGLVNSQGTQDLIVNILSPRQRFEVANYENVIIPTNLEVAANVRDKFAAFYTALFDRMLEKHPGAVVTEYAWHAAACDPCPGPALGPADFLTLGADVLAGTREQPTVYPRADFVLTRLHARYGRSITDDLRFKPAPGLAGGRELVVATGMLEQGAEPSSHNRFQARYAIRHAWSGPLRCAKPRRGVWGGPPPEVMQKTGWTAGTVKPALDLAFAPRAGTELASMLRQDLPELDLRAGTARAEVPSAMPPSGSAAPPAASSKKKSGCGCATTDGDQLPWGALLVLAGMLRDRLYLRNKTHVST